MLHKDIQEYNKRLNTEYESICDSLANVIDSCLTEAKNKLWHGAPVWFLGDNPIVGYSELKSGVRLMFWSGISFDEPTLQAGTGKFKDASITYTSADQINNVDLKRWLEKSKKIQWDYKNIVKRKGRLERLI